MRHLDSQGQELLALLVRKLKTIIPGNPKTYIGYREIHDELGLRLLGPTYGESLKHQGLNNLANWTLAHNKPGITGIIIDRGTLMPGEGYFRLFGKKQEDFEWWKDQIRASQNYDWTPYL